MSDRRPPSEATQALVQGVGMLGLIALGAFVLRGLKTGTIQPTEIAVAFPRYRDAFLHAIVPTLAAVAATALIIGLGMLVFRHSRALLTTRWRYRRRWASVMASERLVQRIDENLVVPQLRAISTNATTDVITVSMLPGQSPADWYARRGSIAAAFGATNGSIRLCKTPADIDLVLSRSHSSGATGKALLLKRPRLLSTPTPARDGRPAATVRGVGLQIGWALISAPASTTTFRKHRVRGSVRWVKFNTTAMAT